MVNSMTNIHAWQFVLLIGAGIAIGFGAFLILFKERLAALRDLEERELAIERETSEQAAHERAYAAALRAKRALMDGEI